MDKEIIIDRLKRGFKFSLNNERQEYYKPISVTNKMVGIYRYTWDRCIYEEIELEQILSWFDTNKAFFLSK